MPSTRLQGLEEKNKETTACDVWLAGISETFDEQRMISVPLKTKVGAKAIYYNLNIFRNINYHVWNKAKINFKQDIHTKLTLLPKYTKISLDYVLYPSTKRLCDLSNVCSIIDKLFCDVLVENGNLPDDNYTHIPEVHYHIGEVDKLNPRCEVIIREIDN